MRWAEEGKRVWVARGEVGAAVENQRVARASKASTRAATTAATQEIREVTLAFEREMREEAARAAGDEVWVMTVVMMRWRARTEAREVRDPGSVVGTRKAALVRMRVECSGVDG